MKMRLIGPAILMTLASAQAATAQDAGEWIVRAGIHSIQPKSHNHALVEVDNEAGVTFNATYMLAPRWGVEVLATMPFVHEIILKGAGKVAEVNQVPPTVSVQYHFNPNGRVRPYGGAGLNYTFFFDEHTSGALEGRRLELDPSFGVAAQAGIDIDFSTDWFVNLDARWFDIDTEPKVDGISLGRVQIDPYAFGLSIGHRF